MKRDCKGPGAHKSHATPRCGARDLFTLRSEAALERGQVLERVARREAHQRAVIRAKQLAEPLLERLTRQSAHPVSVCRNRGHEPIVTAARVYLQRRPSGAFFAISTEFPRCARAAAARTIGSPVLDEAMSATAAKPATTPRLSRAELRRRWRELAGNPVVAAIPCKVELNEKGAIVVSPPTVRHALVQGFLVRELARQRPDGTTLPECPVETEIGIRVPDVVWSSREHMARHGGEKEFSVAPDLCVEVLSPTNTRIEIAEKTAAYLAAGAKEVWIVGDDGVAEIHTRAGRVAASTLGFELPRLPED